MKTDLYRHFGSGGELLYVGISLNSVARMQQHKDAARWFDEIRTITIEKFNTREEALLAETNAIRDEKPLHNIHHNGETGIIAAEEKAFLKLIYEEAYVPHVMEALNDGRCRVKWRNFIGEKHDHICDSVAEAKIYAIKVSSWKTDCRRDEEVFMADCWN